MFIIWGTKKTEGGLGHVAAFCPLCRGIRDFELMRIGAASHIYYISFGKGKLLGHVIRCTDCGVRLAADGTAYQSAMKKKSGDVEALIQATNPAVRETNAARIALEAQIQRSPRSVTPEQRKALLMEPFLLLNPDLESRYAKKEMDKHAGFGCLGTIVIFAGLLIFAESRFGARWSAELNSAAGFVIAAGIIYTVIQSYLSAGRFLRSSTVPQLARALAPLQPTQEEISNCLQQCKVAGMKIGQKVAMEKVWPEIMARTV